MSWRWLGVILNPTLSGIPGTTASGPSCGFRPGPIRTGGRSASGTSASVLASLFLAWGLLFYAATAGSFFIMSKNAGPLMFLYPVIFCAKAVRDLKASAPYWSQVMMPSDEITT